MSEYPGYEHRVMRCKLDRTVTIAGRRYRPGEPIEGELPEKNKDDFEEGVVGRMPNPPVQPGQRVKKIRPEPPVIVQREPGAAGRSLSLDKKKSEKED